jgi:hypothetical protein
VCGREMGAKWIARIISGNARKMHLRKFDQLSPLPVTLRRQNAAALTYK